MQLMTVCQLLAKKRQQSLINNSDVRKAYSLFLDEKRSASAFEDDSTKDQMWLD